MLYIKAANFGDIEQEWALIHDMPENENGCINQYYGISREEFDTAIYQMIEFSKGIGLPEGYVPDTTFFVWNELEPVGLVRVRHYLTDALRKGAGHIGYWVAPQYRDRGVGTEALRLALGFAAELVREDEYFLRVNRDNAASLRVMQKNGGRIVSEDDKYYFVRISKPQEEPNAAENNIIDTENNNG